MTWKGRARDALPGSARRWCGAGGADTMSSLVAARSVTRDHMDGGVLCAVNRASLARIYGTKLGRWQGCVIEPHMVVVVQSPATPR